MGRSEQQGHCPHEGGERLAREQQQKTVADATPIDEIRQPKQHSGRADHRGHDFGAKRHARIVHEADLADDRFDAPEAPGLDVVCRGLSMLRGDDDVLSITSALFDGLYEYRRRALLLGKDPA